MTSEEHRYSSFFSAPTLMSEMKAMAAENRRLKRMYVELVMQNDLLNLQLIRTAARQNKWTRPLYQ